jgi:hypothetical protein
LALSEEDQRRIAQILREELPEKTRKPPFPYRKHLFWAIMTGGLSLPVWIYKSFMHDYNWRKARRERQDNRS